MSGPPMTWSNVFLTAVFVIALNCILPMSITFGEKKKAIVVCLQNGILYGNENEWNIVLQQQILCENITYMLSDRY